MLGAAVLAILAAYFVELQLQINIQLKIYENAIVLFLVFIIRNDF